jgi:hypothetical protein
MKAKQSAEFAAKRRSEERQSGGEIGARSTESAHTHLDYIQDLVSELQHMAQQQGWHVLVAALEIVILAAKQQKRLIR